MLMALRNLKFHNFQSEKNVGGGLILENMKKPATVKYPPPPPPSRIIQEAEVERVKRQQ